ncbi:AsmA-like protein [Sulfuritortus calidifontis]|uniref:AsmA-like protein n=1 Tax=Sulfuritortus calidifontis TaxID=1914471 RepID=A0A4R3JX18_9PROT|nr:AsmA-like C-terminal region-containing protein [Sulfuritortus calidifontis]TCS71476.1 AsmA-like protein [Sulfuritortus calidifontis]
MQLAKRWKIALISLSVVLGGLLVLPFLIPTESYRIRLQEAASEKLGEPVDIGRLSFTLLPWPAATLADLSIGAEQAVKLGAVTVTPDLFSLFDEVKVIQSVAVREVAVNPALLGRIAEWAKPRPGPQTVLVRRVELRGMNLDLGALKWGPLQAEVRMNMAGLQSVQAGPEDGSMTLTLLPEPEERYRVVLEGRQFKLPIKPALLFDSLQGQGRLTKQGLDLLQLNARLYGGDLQAPIRLDWRDGWQVDGTIKTTGVEVSQIVHMLSPSSAFSGRLYADGRYRMAAPSPGELADRLQAKVNFEVKDGVLDKVNLAQAAKLLTRQGSRGGQTRFDRLSGVAEVEGRQYRLREIEISSGILNAKGDVAISPAKELSGQVTVELKATATLVAVPLNVSGTVHDPLLLPSGMAVAGAAVGTGLLGPGLGTAIGSKAGQALEKLFK